MNDVPLSPNLSGDCAQFDRQLADYLERELDASAQHWMDAHRASCATCERTVSELTALVQQAASLADFAPPRDLWSGIAARIETPVATLPLRDAAAEHRTASAAGRPISIRRFAVAAAALVAVTSAVTWQVARPRSNVAVVTTAVKPSTDSTASALTRPVVNVDVVYEQQIAALRVIVDQRFTELDSSTVKELRRNLTIIDQAIADSKAALAKDPGSGAISGSLDRALANKLALMRRVALL